MKMLTGLALTVLASLVTISAASAETVIIRRGGGYHRPYFHPHPPFHRYHRTVIIRR